MVFSWLFGNLSSAREAFSQASCPTHMCTFAASSNMSRTLDVGSPLRICGHCQGNRIKSHSFCGMLACVLTLVHDDRTGMRTTTGDSKTVSLLFFGLNHYFHTSFLMAPFLKILQGLHSFLDAASSPWRSRGHLEQKCAQRGSGCGKLEARSSLHVGHEGQTLQHSSCGSLWAPSKMDYEGIIEWNHHVTSALSREATGGPHELCNLRLCLLLLPQYEPFWSSSTSTSRTPSQIPLIPVTGVIVGHSLCYWQPPSPREDILTPTTPKQKPCLI